MSGDQQLFPVRLITDLIVPLHEQKLRLLPSNKIPSQKAVQVRKGERLRAACKGIHAPLGADLTLSSSWLEALMSNMVSTSMNLKAHPVIEIVLGLLRNKFQTPAQLLSTPAFAKLVRHYSLGGHLTFTEESDQTCMMEKRGGTLRLDRMLSQVPQ